MLDRILHGDDVPSAQSGQMAQAGVNGGGFAAARRTGAAGAARWFGGGMFPIPCWAARGETIPPNVLPVSN